MANNLGNKETMAENIKYYMNLFGEERADVCNALNIKYTTFTDWVNAKTYPRIDKIELMAMHWGIYKADLVEPRCEMNNHATRGIRIPVLGKVAAGLPISAVEDVLDWEEIPERLANTGEFFGLKIQGDSMEPRIYDGDVVIVKRQSDAESGSIVIAQVNGDEAFCKKLIKEESGIILQSLNQSYTPFFFTNKEIEEKPVVILGRVVELRGKF